MTVNAYIGSATIPTVDTFPLTVSGNGRYLVGANSQPFYMIGDAPQSMTVDLAPTDQATSTDAGAYFAARQAQGFNTAWINLVTESSVGGRADGSTYDSITPFTGTISGSYDLTTPRTSYWQRVDALLQIGTDYGFLLILDPLEAIDWKTDAQANGTTRCRTYGQFLGARYSGFPNIIWMHGNDYFSGDWSTYDQYLTEVADGITDEIPDAMHTILLWPNQLQNSTWRPRMAVDAVYSYDPQYLSLLDEYNTAGFLPTFLAEASYEHEHNDGAPLGDRAEVRRQPYFSVTSGATGSLYCEHTIWQFSTDWETYLGSPNSPGADDIAIFAAFVATIPWHTVVPDQAHAFITSGYGTSGGTSYCTAAKTVDGTFGLVFVAFSTNVTLNLALMAGSVTAQWFDPTNGSYSSAGSGLSGSHSFTHPGNNSAGASDWVLLLTA